MAKNAPLRPVEGPPTVPPHVGIELLKKQREKGNVLLANRPIDSDAYSAWENTTREFLTKAFGKGSPNVAKVMGVGAMFIAMAQSEAYWEQRRAENLKTQLVYIDSLIELLETEIQIQGGPTGSSAPRAPAMLTSQKIFVVHGHAEGPREGVARYLEKLGLEPVVLHEQPNKGRTIIEKFTDYSDVGFAVVLMTPDDKGGLISAAPETLKARARQNVILELGFFLGKLTRSRVCALYQAGVEIPSDFSGVLFVELDAAGAWRLLLARELKAVGFKIDMNHAV